MTEALFFNAINVRVACDHKKLGGLRNVYGSWEEVWKKEFSQHKTSEPEDLWRELEKHHVRLLLRGDEEFPELLREIPWQPFAIYAKGNISIIRDPSIAIVGTRKASAEGKKIARVFAEDLSRDFTIVSGLAFGIDAEAHRGCLEKNGKTIAVLATGLDETYPATHDHLAEEIIKGGGLIVSEYPPGIPPLPYRFLERNRIISGLSKGVLVIEAPSESGALATARFALEQNREVFVIPGPITHPNFSGSNELIRKGAELVTKPHDIRMAFDMEAPQRKENTILVSG